MIRVLCAYETKMPGSAAEKLGQREDLEAMLHQLEVESEAAAHRELPGVRQELQTALAAADIRISSLPGGVAPKGLDSVSADTLDGITKAIASAASELGDAADDEPRKGESGDVPTSVAPGVASGAGVVEELRRLARRHSSSSLGTFQSIS